MNIPTHYTAMSESDILRDLHARGYNDDPMLEYVCNYWELKVSEVEDMNQEMQELMEKKEGTELRADSLQGDVDILTREIDDLKNEAERWETKADILQMEVDDLNNQLVFAQGIVE